MSLREREGRVCAWGGLGWGGGREAMSEKKIASCKTFTEHKVGWIKSNSYKISTLPVSEREASAQTQRHCLPLRSSCHFPFWKTVLLCIAFSP